MTNITLRDETSNLFDPEADWFEITFNDRTGKWALWLNGCIIKMAAKEQTLLGEVERRGGRVN